MIEKIKEISEEKHRKNGTRSSEKKDSSRNENSSPDLSKRNETVWTKNDEAPIDEIPIEKRMKISKMKLLDSVDHNTLVTGRCTLNGLVLARHWFEPVGSD